MCEVCVFRSFAASPPFEDSDEDQEPGNEQQQQPIISPTQLISCGAALPSPASSAP